ncbi:MAG: ATP phosphoribosyltransferase regulatory subunit, partial [Nitrososphaerales archaeon]|nr:ATP phosphoribosyltransferase regulatory subunit [Nitrososphaerales archaeon]
MKLNLPRGMRDLDPETYLLIEKVRSVFMDVCRLYDFKIMEPSPIELVSTLKMKSGPAILDEIYYFKDKSGRDVGLRFDLTVGLTRYVVSHRELPLPIKLGAFGGMWRYDEPQYGRYRWFHQWNIEIYGSKSVEADAEVIDFTSTMMNKLGLTNTSIEVGDRSVVEEFIRSKLKIDDKSRILEMLRALDKVGRKGVSVVLEEYSNEAERKNLEDLIRFGEIKGRAEDVLNRLRDLGLKSQT